MNIQNEIKQYKRLGEAKYYSRMLNIGKQNKLDKINAKKFAKKATKLIKLQIEKNDEITTL